MNKYYHRGKGEVVCPPECPEYKETSFTIKPLWDVVVNAIAVYAHCSPDLPVGWFEGREVKQLQNANKTYWGECSEFVFDIANDNVRRIWIEPVAEPHKCQYCGAMTTQHDDQCWNNPKNFKYAEGEDDVANDFHKANQPDFQREAKEFYPFDEDDDCWDEKQKDLRRAHIKARQMSAGEVEELRKEVEKWENEAKEAWKKIEIHKGYGDRYKKAHDELHNKSEELRMENDKLRADMFNAVRIESEMRDQVRKLRDGLAVLILCAPAVSNNVLESPVTLAEYYEALETAKELLKETEG